MRSHDIQSDSKGRINLGAAYAQQRFLVIEEGDRIIIEKAVVIPERELWLHKNPEAKKAVERGITEAKKGRIRKNAVDLDHYEEA